MAFFSSYSFLISSRSISYFFSFLSSLNIHRQSSSPTTTIIQIAKSNTISSGHSKVAKLSILNSWWFYWLVVFVVLFFIWVWTDLASSRLLKELYSYPRFDIPVSRRTDPIKSPNPVIFSLWLFTWDYSVIFTCANYYVLLS